MKILEALLQYGLGGIVMGGVMFIVVKPLLGTLLKQLDVNAAQTKAANQQMDAAIKERRELCAQHQAFHVKTNAVLDGLLSSVNALVSRANGGK